MKSITRRSLFILPAALLLAGGCSTPTPATGEQIYNKASGRLVAVEAAPLDTAFPATMAAFKTLHLRPFDQSRDGFGGRIVGTNAGGQDIVADLKELTDKTTQITLFIRVLTRDEIMLRRVLAEIQKEIKNRS